MIIECDRKTRPELTPEQLEKCRRCLLASERKIWCCEFGFSIPKEKNRIILPNRKPQYPSKMQMAKNFAGSMKDFAKSGFKIRSKAEQIRCTAICKSNKCGMYDVRKLRPNRCKACGCCMSLAKLIESKRCPLKFF